jgi:integrase
MANLGIKNGVYLARFRYLGKEYKKSLKTSNHKAAEGAMHRVRDALHRLAINTLAVPEGVDPGDFIVSGGTLTKPSARPSTGKMRKAIPTLNAAADEYLQNLEHLAASNRYTIGVHLRNLKKKLTGLVDEPIDRIQKKHVEAFLQARLRERARTTVVKERETVQQFFAWAVRCEYIVSSPTNELTKVTASTKLPPFRTVAEIEASIGRGGLSRAEEWALWECLFLQPSEIAGILAMVRERHKRDVSYILHAVPAFTGMRRGELLRLTWSDIEFEQNSLVARSKKQSRQEEETTRRIDLHPELKAILLRWQKQRPTGQYVACDADSTSPLTPKQANQRFWQPLRGTKWCLASRKNRFKIGFHAYRHSFASNLAAAGVDQRLIDEFMGHQTETMRKRYRHLFPSARRSAIESFSLARAEG